VKTEETTAATSCGADTMQAVATSTLSATSQPSADCPSVELADPAASQAASTTATNCRLATTTATADQNSNVVVEMKTNHNHHDADSFDDAVSQPSTLTLRLIMQGKVRYLQQSRSLGCSWGRTPCPQN